MGANNFEHDALGRLDRAWLAGHALDYDFAAGNTCGANRAAGINTNRTNTTDNGTTIATYCYDSADPADQHQRRPLPVRRLRQPWQHDGAGRPEPRL